MCDRNHVARTFDVLQEVNLLELIILFQASLCSDRGLEVLESVVIVAFNTGTHLFFWKQCRDTLPVLKLLEFLFYEYGEIFFQIFVQILHQLLLELFCDFSAHPKKFTLQVLVLSLKIL